MKWKKDPNLIDELSTDGGYDNISISIIILREFGTDVKYIKNLTKDMLDWKYVTLLNKCKNIVNGKNSQGILGENFT